MHAGDRSGDIDEAELHVALHMLGLEATSGQSRRILAKFDADRSGRIELDEFRRLCARRGRTPSLALSALPSPSLPGSPPSYSAAPPP